MTEKLKRNSILILANMIKAKRPLPVRKIAERNNISWKTANDNIKILEKRGLVKCEKSKRRNYCQVSKRLLEEL